MSRGVPQMKKSRSIKLVLLGGASLALAACGDDVPPDARFFASAEECAVTYSEAACQDAFKKSEQTFAAEAPKFTRQEECEAQFGAGNCETKEAANASGGGMGSFIMPMMMGYMMGNLMSGGFNRPVYRGPNNSAMMGNQGKFYNVGSFAGAGKSANFSASPVTQTQRGGFGTAGRSYASAGG